MTTTTIGCDDHDLAALARAVCVVPHRTASAAVARHMVGQDGAAILTGLGSLEADAAREHAAAVVGPSLRSAPDVFTVVVDDDDLRVKISRELSDRLVTLDLHTDGYSYGDELPDWLFLGCASSSPFGGSSILTDGYAVLEALRRSGGAWAELADVLRTVDIDQVPAFQPRGCSKAVQFTDAGRCFMRRNAFQRVADDATPGEGTDRRRHLIELWHAMWNLLSRAATPFRLAPGELLCIDNYRVQHGRLPFVGAPRTYQRVWAWSAAAAGMPAALPSVSDWKEVVSA